MRYNSSIATKKITDLEESVRTFWEQNDIFRKSVAQRPAEKTWTFYDGPPFATGLPHYGHILAGALKDIYPRYFTMQGYRVNRRWGWDCHGVPIEYEVEKENKIKGTKEIEEQGIAKFNELCRSVVLRRRQEWRASQRALGRFVDMDNDYKTMDKDFMESVWKVFCEINNKGLVYEGQRVIAYSPGLGTPLSDFEARLGYKEVTDPAVTVTFPLVDDPTTALLAWTTTPWSMQTNVAIAINPKLAYTKVTTTQGKKYIVAKKLVATLFPAKEIKSEESFDINSLIGKHYAPMFDTVPAAQRAACYVVVASDHVTDSDGTGMVHISPAHGDDDYKVGQKNGLPVLDYCDRDCVFTGGIAATQGKFFKEADSILIQQMKQQGRLFKQEEYKHEYPFCWRTEKPLMYRAIPSWYIKVTAIKDKLIANNQQINWQPHEVGSGRFGNWLENARDWSVSRDRYWGCPVPIWRNVSNPNDVLFISSVAELEALTGATITDLHRHYIDDLIVQKDGKTYKRIPQVFDCWFESGAMPYAQEHYMFDNDQDFLTRFPADFIAEGVDQTRGWFYTLNVIATALYDKPAFKNCVVNGILLGNDGRKMSKRDKNYPDMNDVFAKYGADALRFFLLGSSATQAQDLAVDEAKMDEVIKQVLLPLLNAYNFFATYANNAGYQSGAENFTQLTSTMDQWLIARTEQFKKKIMASYDQCNSVGVSQEIRSFIEDLTNWYLHNSRRAFSSAQPNRQSFACLHYALTTISLCAAPIIPYMTEVLYRALNGAENSVHLQDWPKPMPIPQYEPLLPQVEKVRAIVALGMQARDSSKMRLRQPLSTLYLSRSLQTDVGNYHAFIQEALNVKNIEWIDDATAEKMMEKVIKLNPHVAGKKYGKDYKQMTADVTARKYQWADKKLVVTGKTLDTTDYTIQFVPKDGKGSAENNGIWTVIDLTLTPELKREGSVRDFMRELQENRKQAGYTIDQRVEVQVGPEFLTLIQGYEDLIERETGCVVSAAPLQNISHQGVIEIKVSGSIQMCVAPEATTRVNIHQSTVVTPMWQTKPSSALNQLQHEICTLLQHQGTTFTDTDKQSIRKRLVSAATKPENSWVLDLGNNDVKMLADLIVQTHTAEGMSKVFEADKTLHKAFIKKALQLYQQDTKPALVKSAKF